MKYMTHEKPAEHSLSKPHSLQNKPSLKIAITGASGLVGSNLVLFLRSQKHQTFKIVRKLTGEADEILWNISQQTIEADKLEGMDVIIHLAGESLSAYWTTKKKEAIRASRIQGTTLLSKTILKLQSPPKLLISASAIGYYPCSDTASYTEKDKSSSSFLGTLCQEWEQATEIVSKETRVVNLRIGVVLSLKGGALPQMLRPFHFGIGGKIGSGSQWLSWIALDDLIGLIYDIIWKKTYIGAVNATSPAPIRNSDFTAIVSKLLLRPKFVSTPAFVIRLLLGEMGDALMLNGANVIPQKALESQFQFQFPTLEIAMRYELQR